MGEIALAAFNKWKSENSAHVACRLFPSTHSSDSFDVKKEEIDPSTPTTIANTSPNTSHEIPKEELVVQHLKSNGTFDTLRREAIQTLSSNGSFSHLQDVAVKLIVSNRHSRPQLSSLRSQSSSRVEQFEALKSFLLSEHLDEKIFELVASLCTSSGDLQRNLRKEVTAAIDVLESSNATTISHTTQPQKPTTTVTQSVPLIKPIPPQGKHDDDTNEAETFLTELFFGSTNASQRTAHSTGGIGVSHSGGAKSVVVKGAARVSQNSLTAKQMSSQLPLPSAYTSVDEDDSDFIDTRNSDSDNDNSNESASELDEEDGQVEVEESDRNTRDEDREGRSKHVVDDEENETLDELRKKRDRKEESDASDTPVVPKRKRNREVKMAVQSSDHEKSDSPEGDLDADAHVMRYQHQLREKLKQSKDAANARKRKIQPENVRTKKITKVQEGSRRSSRLKGSEPSEE